MSDQLENLYGCKASGIDMLAAQLGQALSITLEDRDSSYWGDYYVEKSGRFSEFRLYRNRDPLYQPANDPEDDYWLEPDHRESASLLYVFGLADIVKQFHAEISSFTPAFTLLRQQTANSDS